MNEVAMIYYTFDKELYSKVLANLDVDFYPVINGQENEWSQTNLERLKKYKTIITSIHNRNRYIAPVIRKYGRPQLYIDIEHDLLFKNVPEHSPIPFIKKLICFREEHFKWAQQNRVPAERARWHKLELLSAEELNKTKELTLPKKRDSLVLFSHRRATPIRDKTLLVDIFGDNIFFKPFSEECVAPEWAYRLDNSFYPSAGVAKLVGYGFWGARGSGLAEAALFGSIAIAPLEHTVIGRDREVDMLDIIRFSDNNIKYLGIWSKSEDAQRRIRYLIEHEEAYKEAAKRSRDYFFGKGYFDLPSVSDILRRLL